MTAPSRYAELNGRHILLGVTGGIAAYKSVELVRLLKKDGADVQALMTPDAARFVTPLTLGTVSERPVLSETFPENREGSWTQHVSLGQWADLFVIAPATAQTLAKLAGGFADNLITATALAARCPILVCPSMDHDMFVHPATRRNLETLAGYGHIVTPPAHGPLASGLIGEGRLPEPEEIRERIIEMVSPEPVTGRLEHRRVLVTAGPTREHMDPVRFLGNPSSGKMGFALAEAAARRGARVTLVSGPVRLDTPPDVERIDVESAGEMLDAVMDHRDSDIVIMAAAVSDYAPVERALHKLKKQDGELTLRLVRTPDILRTLREHRSENQVFVGFAMETDNGLANAHEKLEAKNLDWIVLNMFARDSGFEADTNRMTLLSRNGHEETLPLMSKRQAAEIILNRIAASLPGRPAA